MAGIILKSQESRSNLNGLIVGVNDILTRYPAIAVRMIEAGVDPTTVKATNTVVAKVYCHVCKQNSESTIALLCKNPHNCRVCNGTDVAPGINDLRTEFPDIAIRVEAAGVDPSTRLGRSSENLPVKCFTCNQITTVNNSNLRKYPNVCGVCAGLVVAAGVNDMATLNPIAAKRVKAAGGDPTIIVAGTNKKQKVKCFTCEQVGEMSGRSLLKNPNACLVCIGRVIVPGVNDMATKNPYVASRVKAAGADPTLIPPSPAAKQPVLCFTCNQVTHVVGPDLVRNPNYCSVCAGKTVVPGVNDLESKVPEAGKRVRAAGGDPSKISYGSEQKVAAKCFACESVVQVTPNHLSHAPDICGKCGDKRERTEKLVHHALRRNGFPNAKHKVTLPVVWGRTTRGAHVDVFIEDFFGEKVVVEYDGYYWHNLPRKRNDDMEKTKALLEAGCLVVRIREQKHEGEVTLRDLDIDNERLIQIKHACIRNLKDRSGYDVLARNIFTAIHQVVGRAKAQQE